MLNSLRLYTKYFLKTALRPERKIVCLDLNRYLFHKNVFRKIQMASGPGRSASLDQAAEWLMTAQKATGDGGMGSFHLANQWSSSYPETTGYIIPTLISYSRLRNNPEAAEAAMTAADFLLAIQKPGGGWQGGRVNENRPEIVFNTGQVIRGMITAYENTGKKVYLDAAVRAGEWLCQIQHPEGYWKKHALMNEARVYDTFVDAPLLQLYDVTGDLKFRDAAVRNLSWAVGLKMLDNGWFEDCDNTIRRNDRPILHTIAYTLDGLIDCGLMLNDQLYVDAAGRGARVLRDLFLERGFLYGRYDRAWKGREYFICTGGAQMAIVWMKLFRITRDQDYLSAAQKMIDLLIFIQNRYKKEGRNTFGAIPGSFPIWGRYEPFAFPNWATKFFCDALMLEREVRS